MTGVFRRPFRAPPRTQSLALGTFSSGVTPQAITATILTEREAVNGGQVTTVIVANAVYDPQVLRPAVLTVSILPLVVKDGETFGAAVTTSVILAQAVPDEDRFEASSLHFTLVPQILVEAEAFGDVVVTVHLHPIALQDGSDFGAAVVTSTVHGHAAKDRDAFGANVVTSFVHPKPLVDPESVGAEQAGDDTFTLYLTPKVVRDAETTGASAVSHGLIAKTLADPESFKANNPGRFDSAVVYNRFEGHQGTQKRKKKRGKVAFHERQITITDRDGKTRKVSFLDRFKPPPPLTFPPDWVVPDEAPLAPRPELPVPDFAEAPVEAPALDVDELKQLRDEADLINLLMGMPDPTLVDLMQAIDDAQDVQDINRLLEEID
jgi:hypothetical protein